MMKKILVVCQERTESDMGLKEWTSIANLLDIVTLISTSEDGKERENAVSALCKVDRIWKGQCIPTADGCVQMKVRIVISPLK